MNKIAELTWYTKPPLKEGEFYGTIKDWTQTLMTIINQASAKIFEYQQVLSVNNPDTQVSKREVIVPENFHNQFKLLVYYNSQSEKLGERKVTISGLRDHILVIENNYCVTIKLINEPYVGS